MKFLPSVKAQKEADRRAKLYRELLQKEAKVGGELFGPVQPGGRREFFCLDRHTWIWHEEWIDAQTRRPSVVTTRYDIRPNGILKTQDGHNARYIDGDETRRLYYAAKLYQQRVTHEVYGMAV